MTTYSSLNNVKDELVIAYAVTTNDIELTNLLNEIDSHINTRLQRYTSLPVQQEIASAIGGIEARWVAARFRFRRATPQEQNQYQVLLKNIEESFQQFLGSNFGRRFRAVGSMTDKQGPVDYGQYNNQDSGLY